MLKHTLAIRPPEAGRRRKNSFGLLSAALCLLLAASLSPALPTARGIKRLTAQGSEKRIDLRWNPVPAVRGYKIFRSEKPDGPFRPLTRNPYIYPAYSDFIGKNGVKYYYRVTAVERRGGESRPSETVSASSRTLSLEERLTDVQRAAFRYFYDYGHPVSGLARERTGSRRCTIGGSGFGLMTLMVGAHRGFAPRTAVVRRLLRILRFLEEKADRFHGAFPHHLDGATGKTRPFAGPRDDGGDLVETSFLVQGLLTIRGYFRGKDPLERELRERATRLWRAVEWDWYLRRPGGRVLYWHWSPRHGWAMNHRIRGFNECLITYLLAVASPTHPISPSCYYEGWAGSKRYANGKTYYGYKLAVGPAYGGPLFFTQFSFLGFDPRGKRDKFCNYFENNRIITMINRAHCIRNPNGFPGYGPRVWGLSSSDDPEGYKAHDPVRDNGTITPSVALSAMPYTPRESMDTLKHLYDVYGKRLWGPFGFWDAFNLKAGWFARSALAIDVGTIAPMIENHRSGLCWRSFMANEEIERALEKIGWRRDG